MLRPRERGGTVPSCEDSTSIWLPGAAADVAEAVELLASSWLPGAAAGGEALRLESISSAAMGRGMSATFTAKRGREGASVSCTATGGSESFWILGSCLTLASEAAFKDAEIIVLIESLDDEVSDTEILRMKLADRLLVVCAMLFYLWDRPALT
jgi:hypothetical protein